MFKVGGFIQQIRSPTIFFDGGLPMRYLIAVLTGATGLNLWSRLALFLLGALFAVFIAAGVVSLLSELVHLIRTRRR